MKKNFKAGYVGKPDSMRDLARRLMNHPGSQDDTYPSKSAADKEPMRPYAKGGSVKSQKRACLSKSVNHCYAMGGVAKIRLGEATKSGKPIARKSKRSS